MIRPTARPVPARTAHPLRGAAPALVVATLVVAASLLLPAAARAAPGGGQFVIRCPHSHANMDDPIVFPGKPGASHLHDYYGNRSVNAFSTMSSMLVADTTCRVPSDTAGYWVPALYVNGQRVVPPVTRVYYIGGPNEDVETFPPGLEMIGGNKLATSPAENPHVSWYCGETVQFQTPREDTPYDCTPYADHAFVDGVIMVIDMPSCWDGVGLRPEDVVYPVGGECPADFPHVLPKISQRVHTHVMNPLNADGTVAFSLSSGPYWTLHADFWNTWQQPRLDQLVSECIVAGVHCGAVGPAPEPAWTRQFGTRRYDLTLGLADGPGGIYAVGTTNLTLPGQKRFHRTDGFLRVYGAGGAARWTRQFGTSGIDRALDVVVDHSGVYVVGSTDGLFRDQHRAGGVDAFVRRYDLQGNELWTRQFGGPGDDEATTVTLTPQAIYVAGSWGGERGTGGLGSDGFVRRYLRNGRLAWRELVRTEGTDRILALAATGSRVYVGGSTSAAVASGNDGGTDGFVEALAAGGGSLWARQIGTAGEDAVTGLLVRGGHVFATGSTGGALAGSLGGERDGFLLRLDGAGRTRWLRQFGSPGLDDVHGIDMTSTGILVAGATTGALPDQALLGETDAFLVKYDVKGAQLWASQFGTDDFDAGLALTANDRAAYVGGETHGTFPGQTNEGDRDAFVTKIAFR